MKEKFKDYRKRIPLNESIYISVNHNVEFTSVKKTGTKYDSLYVDADCILGNKRYLVLTWR